MEKYNEYVTEFTYNGKKYGSEILAKSFEEAEEILKAKKQTEIILGVIPYNCKDCKFEGEIKE